MNIYRSIQEVKDAGRIKPNSLINSDCFDSMKYIESKSIDMIFADLPYGTTKNKWDSVLDLNLLWEEYNRLCKGFIVLTSSQPFTSILVCSNLEQFRYEIIWEKNKFSNFLDANKKPMKIHESILVFSKGVYNPQYWYLTPYKRWNTKDAVARQCNYGLHNTNVMESKDGRRQPLSVITFNRQERSWHPTQKPVGLLEYLIRTYSNEGDTILDNCAGSFTTAVACDNTSRNWICIDKNKDYCERGYNRIKENREISQI